MAANRVGCYECINEHMTDTIAPIKYQTSKPISKSMPPIQRSQPNLKTNAR